MASCAPLYYYQAMTPVHSPVHQQLLPWGVLVLPSPATSLGASFISDNGEQPMWYGNYSPHSEAWPHELSSYSSEQPVEDNGEQPMWYGNYSPHSEASPHERSAYSSEQPVEENETLQHYESPWAKHANVVEGIPLEESETPQHHEPQWAKRASAVEGIPLEEIPTNGVEAKSLEDLCPVSDLPPSNSSRPRAGAKEGSREIRNHTPMEPLRRSPATSMSWHTYKDDEDTEPTEDSGDVPSPPPSVAAAELDNGFGSTYSLGSVGHPLACAAACKYVKKSRGCKDGDQCTHCHLCKWHNPRPNTYRVKRDGGRRVARKRATTT